MPITKSAKKALRQNAKRREKNFIYKTKIKILAKKAEVLISQKKTKEAMALLPQIYKALDKAARAGIVKKNTASRKKSRIARRLGKLN